MSGKSLFINIPGKEPAAFMKEAHADTLTGLYYFTISGVNINYKYHKQRQ